MDRFRGDSKLSSWLYRIATNAALMKLRKRPKVKAIIPELQQKLRSFINSTLTSRRPSLWQWLRTRLAGS
ncbi:MAG: hypothetical protein HYY90_03745 [Candidatus Omnitrophica bacterium]|nr:hypothetical protein [Candidatus Omnitrophota bacterium]MBI3083455.1 hypothetical protein [Candidatus Omnitrophota bacterium]